MPGCTTEVEQATFSEDNHRVTVREHPLVHLVAMLTGVLDIDFLDPSDLRQCRHLDLVVKVADIADDRIVFHPGHMIDANHILVASGGDENICVCHDIFKSLDLIAFHQGLQGANRVDLRYDDSCTLATQGLATTFADITVTADNRDLTGKHYVGRPHDAVDQTVSTTIDIVKLALGHRIVDVHCREREFTNFLQMVQAVDPGCGLFCDSFNGFADSLPVN